MMAFIGHVCVLFSLCAFLCVLWFFPFLFIQGSPVYLFSFFDGSSVFFVFIGFFTIFSCIGTGSVYVMYALSLVSWRGGGESFWFWLNRIFLFCSFLCVVVFSFLFLFTQAVRVDGFLGMGVLFSLFIVILIYSWLRRKQSSLRGNLEAKILMQHWRMFFVSAVAFMLSYIYMTFFSESRFVRGDAMIYGLWPLAGYILGLSIRTWGTSLLSRMYAIGQRNE